MWYVLYTKAGEEEKCADKCRNAFSIQAYCSVFVPRYICMKRYQGEWHEEKKVLFPGYFFVDTECPKDIEAMITSTLSDLVSPVRVGRDFVPIYPEEQKFLDELFDADYTVPMSRGDIVSGRFEIYEGPLMDKPEHICRVDRHKRLAEFTLPIHGEIRKIRLGLEIVNKS